MSKWIVVGTAIALVLLAVRGFSSAQGGVSAAQAAAVIKEKKDLQLIDVRTQGEYVAGHLEHARLIPLQELQKRLGEIDKSKPILLYCRTGRRSGEALRLLAGEGFPDVRHIEGGIVAWQAAGLPVSK